MDYVLTAQADLQSATRALRQAGSDLWFNGLSEDWQQFLAGHTLDCHKNYRIPLAKAALAVVRVYQNLLLADPSVKDANPWQIDGAFSL
ncbi:hypothetical protein Q4485_13150 [Granulosicoccaceae sp. 1_MG-2023]|nr:hypothetical protein [Granulosicoccaceae sp. 1_MG-2023]